MFTQFQAVEVYGLTNATQYNSCVGTVLSELPNGRFQVKLFKSDKQLSILPENLKRAILGVQNSEYFEPRFNDHSGWGLIATAPIAKGTLILQEEPLLIIPRGMYNPQQLKETISMMSTNAQEIFRSFSPHGAMEHRDIQILSRNALENGENKRAMFGTICRLNHSCDPNVEWFWHENLEVEFLTATTNIAPGEELLASYQPVRFLGMATKDRREFLQKKYGFLCECSACQRENDADRIRYKHLWDQIPGLVTCNPGVARSAISEVRSIIMREFNGNANELRRNTYDMLQLNLSLGKWKKAFQDGKLYIELSKATATAMIPQSSMKGFKDKVSKFPPPYRKRLKKMMKDLEYIR